MADRSVLVSLKADVRDFVTQMRRATEATESTRQSSEQTQEEATSAIGQLVASASEAGDAWESVGAAMSVTGAGIAATVLLATNAFSEFDAAMSTVAADTHETSANLGLMADAALEAGADTQYSATEAASAIDELAKAGVSTADVLDGGLSGALSLAAAGSLEVATAAEIAATALTQFDLKGSDVGHVADLLAAGAGKAQGSVEDLGMALNQGGLVASQMGLSLEETTGTLAAMASAGLVGSDAGTSLKTSLLMLANPSEKAAGLMDELGIKAYDASGQFVGMASLAGQLQARLGGLTQEQRDSALATIFGSDAIRAANVLYSEGSIGIAGWTTRVDDAGYAAITAATKMDNLKGDLEMLKGALDTALINTGSGGDNFLRQQVQSVEALVDAYNQLPEPAQRAVFGLAGSASAALLAGGAFLAVAPRVLELGKQFKELNASGSKIPGTMKKVAVGVGVLVALAAAGAALSVFTDDAEAAVMSSSEATAALARTTDTIAIIDRSVAGLSTGDSNGFSDLASGLKNLADPSLLDRLNDTSASILSITGLYSSKGRPERAAFVEQLGAMGEGLANLAQNGAADQAAEHFAKISEQAAAAGISQEQLLDLMPQYRDALADQETKQAAAAASGESLASSVTGIAEQTEDAAAASEKFSDALDSLLAQFFDVDAASDAFYTTLNQLADAAKQNGRELEGNSEKAIANREAMRSSADAAAQLLQAMSEQGFTSDEISAKAVKLKEDFLAQASAAGFTGEQVDKVAAAYDAMPELVKTQVVADGLDSMLSKILATQRAVTELDGRKIKVTTVFEGGTAPIKNFSGAGVQVARADGGLIPLGLGGPRQDNVLAAVSSGEFVVNAAQTARYRGLLEAINAGEIPAFADGGLIGGSAGQTVSTSYLTQQMGAAEGPVSGDRYTQSLRAARRSALMAATAEAALAGVRAESAAGLEDLKRKLDDAEQAQSDAADAAEERAQAEIDRLKKAKGSDAAVEAAQERLKALKKGNEQASKDLDRANKDRIATAEDAYDQRVTDAQTRLTAAKDQDSAATRELKDAESELAAARQQALQLAEQVSRSLTSGAALGTLFSDKRAGSITATARALEQAGAAADLAGGTMRGENGAAALSRRSSALSGLASAASDYAAAQTAAGTSAAEVDAGLQGAIGRVQSLGAQYGLAADEVERLVAGLAAQTTAAKGTSLLANMTAEAERAEELAANVKALMAAGLDRGLVDQVIAGGTSTGLDMARSILGGGGGLVAQLNGLQGRITANGDALGAYVSADRYAPGGAKEIKVAPVQIASGKLDVGEIIGGKVRLSDPAALDAQTLGTLASAFLAAAKSIPAPIVNVTQVSSPFASAK